MTLTRTIVRSRKLRYTAPLLATLAAAATLALAPPAVASANQIECRDRGGASVCQKHSHAALIARPAVRPPANGLLGAAWLPGYGKGHLPPILALD